ELSTARQPDHPQVRSWDDFPIKEHLGAAFGVRTLLDQDVYLMAQAEQRFGWTDARVLLCVKVGTVISCGVVVDGRVVRGAQSMAGEIGHTRVSGRDVPCWCGNAGCLDAVAGGGALASALTARGLPCSSARDVSRLAVAGVPEAVQLVRAAGRDIGEVLSGAINLLNPGVIVFWGYLAEAEEPLFAGLHETIYQRSLPSVTRKLTLARTRLGDDTGTIGAAMMVIDEVLSEAAIDGTSFRPGAEAAST
ncbi:MAG TPA: ROK family protein, partial [bacterium]|nr:ROK family protein [bacterium]